MTANQAGFPVEAMARAMGVSRSGFHARSRREPSARDPAERELLAKIRRIRAASRETCGAPRIHAEPAAEGVHAGRKRVERLMKADAPAGVGRRRGTRTTSETSGRARLAISSIAASAPKGRISSGSPT
jgi:putative transposase